MNCKICDTELVGGLDTYGDHGMEVCRSCFFESHEQAESWYGLAPHYHAYDMAGNIIIGGTTFKPLIEPDQNGVYRIDGLYFSPDPDAPDCGIWYRGYPA